MDQEELKRRTKKLALDVIKLYNLLPKTEEAKIIGRQFVKSGTSIGANYRAAILGRSKKKLYAKICIVVEETDETVYWMEILEESKIFKHPLILEIKNEAGELLLIFSKTRKTTKDSL